MQRAIEILSVFFVAVGVVWFLLAQGLGIMRGICEIRRRKHDHLKGRDF